MKFENQRLVDYTDSIPIRDSDGNKAFELVREPKGLFLYVKCRLTTIPASRVMFSGQSET